LDEQDREADTDAKTILVVDDEPLVAELIRDLVEADGHNCLVAGDADEADRILAGNRVDGITLDMVMPGRNGLDWLEALAAETPELARRTLFITGSRLGPVERLRLEQCGAVLFTKPFDHQCVIEALRNRLGLG
jgi:two-component system NtrC family sensor kinase